MNTYKIIANADDFGRHPLINAAVEKAVEQGCLRSATIMPTGVAFEEAIEIAKKHSELGLGIHLTLVNANSLLAPEKIPSLVDENGRFVDNYLVFVQRFFRGKINLEDVRKELTAQVEKVMATGAQITHIDSHQHMHTLPGIIDIALDLAEVHGIKAVRIPKTPFFTGFSGNPIQLAGRLGLYTMAALAEGRAKKRGFHCPDHFAGIVAGEAVSTEQLTGIINNLQPGTTEIMVHPGTDNAQLMKDCQWEHDFEAELAGLISPEIQGLLHNKQVESINFRDLLEKRG